MPELQNVEERVDHEDITLYKIQKVKLHSGYNRAVDTLCVPDVNRALIAKQWHSDL